jgi:hypothetical protein
MPSREVRLLGTTVLAVGTFTIQLFQKTKRGESLGSAIQASSAIAIGCLLGGLIAAFWFDS